MSFERKTIELRVQDTKGKARRLVPLNDEALNALLRLRAFADEFFPDTQWVFTHTKPRYFGTRFQSVSCPSSKHLGRLSLFCNRGSGSSWFDVKPLCVDGSSGVFGWSVS